MFSDDSLLIKLSCLNLPSSSTNQGARIAVTIRLPNGNFLELGQTETKIGVNPIFEKAIPICFKPDTEQHLRLILYEIDASTEVIQGKLGEADVNLLTLLWSADELALPLYRDASDHANPHPPVVLANASPDNSSLRGTALQFAGTNLNSITKNHNLLMAPYFVLQLVPSKLIEHAMPILLYRSEVCVQSCDNPRWKEFIIPSRFFPSTQDYTLELLVYNFCNNRNQDLLLGRVCTTFYQLLNSTTKFMLSDDSKRKESSSIELIQTRSAEDIQTSLSYEIKLGMQLHFTLAIDFTTNNGGPNDPTSLHYIHPHIFNTYQETLKAIGPDIMKFDRLNRVSLLGFGAKLPPHFEFSDIFALNSNMNNSYVRGLDSVLQCYRNSAMSCLPYAPTNFSEIIHHTIKMAKASQKTSTNLYFVLIVLTNGSIKKIQDSVDSIVKASRLPISIVFVTVGNNSHPIASLLKGNTDTLKELTSPTLKSSSNLPLYRETTSLISAQHNSAEMTLAKIFSAISRQVVLYSLGHQFQCQEL